MTKSKNGHSISKSSEAIQCEERGWSALARIFWILIGNVILIFLPMSIYRKGTFSGRDLFFWGTVILLIVVRYCDIKYLGGLTAQGQPATFNHWRKYAVLVLLISLGIWLFTRLVIYLHK